MWTYLSPKFDNCAQNLSSLATRRTSTLSIKRCWPLRLSAALAFSDSSGRMKFSVRVWLTTSSPVSMAAGVIAAQYFEEELQDIDRDVCAHLDAADEVLSDDASGKRVVGGRSRASICSAKFVLHDDRRRDCRRRRIEQASSAGVHTQNLHLGASAGLLVIWKVSTFDEYASIVIDPVTGS